MEEKKDFRIKVDYGECAAREEMRSYCVGFKSKSTADVDCEHAFEGAHGTVYCYRKMGDQS